MANPYEFREMMYNLIYEGELPESAKKANAAAHIEATKKQLEAARKGETTLKGKDATTALSSLAALADRANRLREQRKD